MQDRFWSRVLKKNDCWLWAGTKAARGYGEVWHNGRMRLAHRVAYEPVKGKISQGKILLHSCDNRACVNPDHLAPGTNAENMRDMYTKGRRPYHPPKLSGRDRRRIRSDYALGGVTHDGLAERFGVSERTIRRALAKEATVAA